MYLPSADDRMSVSHPRRSGTFEIAYDFALSPARTTASV